MFLKEKREERLSNRLVKEHDETLRDKRAESLDNEHERDKRMVEKVKLEKLFVQESRNKMADKTFSQGQSILAKIVTKHSRAGSRKN